MNALAQTPPTILVVEDDPHLAAGVAENLRAEGYTVFHVADGREALDVLRRDSDVDLVLLDLMMPHLSGLDVLAAMRGDERWRNVPCIILTAAGQEQQHTSAMTLGADDFLTKPFSPKKLYARAAELVGLSPDDSTTEAS